MRLMGNAVLEIVVVQTMGLDLVMRDCSAVCLVGQDGRTENVGGV